MNGKRKSPTQNHEPSDHQISMEDAELWDMVKATATPLDKKSRDTLIDTGMVPDQKQRSSIDKPVQNELKKTESERRIPTSERPKPPQPQTSFDRRQIRQLATGRKEIDARLDLHGLRQKQAYSALKAFFIRSQSQGHRHVLIITGKGAPRDDETEKPFYEDQDRGVLRRLVPQWLREPEFSAYVVGYTKAHARHGGEGALYVRLRRLTKNFED